MRKYIEISQTCHNRNEKKLFGVRTKLLYYKVFPEYLLTTEMKKTENFLNKPVYLGLSILKLRKILMYELLYDHVKLKYGEMQNFAM